MVSLSFCLSGYRFLDSGAMDRHEILLVRLLIPFASLLKCFVALIRLCHHSFYYLSNYR